tara:strand:+ start:144 stop:407 length:264 start_codon:yes stop_codon:yes gene_type:complete
MEKIIFFGLVIPIMAFVLYLGVTAIMKGFKAKEENRSEKEQEINKNSHEMDENNNLSDELNKLNNLLQKGIITQEEFEKAKKKILEN